MTSKPRGRHYKTIHRKKAVLPESVEDYMARLWESHMAQREALFKRIEKKMARKKRENQ